MSNLIYIYAKIYIYRDIYCRDMIHDIYLIIKVKFPMKSTCHSADGSVELICCYVEQAWHMGGHWWAGPAHRVSCVSSKLNAQLCYICCFGHLH